jgi:hypothetical protein
MINDQDSEQKHFQLISEPVFHKFILLPTIKQMNVTFLIEPEDTKCPVCLSTVTTPLIQCQNGKHFICLDCIKKCPKKCCPQCSSRVFHNIFIERVIKDQLVVCLNEKCEVLSFPWAIDEHKRECNFNESRCHYCIEQVSKVNRAQHFQSNCNLLWINDSFDEGSDILIEKVRSDSRGITLTSLNKVKLSFCVISKDLVTVFQRNQSEWSVDIVILNENSDTLEVTYWLPRREKSFDRSTRITINPSKITKQLLVTIPIESIELQLQVVGKRTCKDASIDGYFRSLLEQGLAD